MSAALYLRGPNKKINEIKTAGEIKIIGGATVADEATVIKKIKKIIINSLIFN